MTDDSTYNLSRMLFYLFYGFIQETYGEDPYLTSRIISAHVQGLQGNHTRYKRALDVCKHFDAHSGPENIPQSRFSFDANVS